MQFKKLIYIMMAAAVLFGCQEKSDEDTTVEGQLGINGVMPTIGRIYIEDVKPGENDGDISDMRKAHLIYKLSADIVLDNYNVLEGGQARCVWSSNRDDTKISPSETILAKNKDTGIWECAAVTVNFNKRDDYDYNPDTVISLSFKDNAGNTINYAGTDNPYSTTTTLNTTDRHNLINVATSTLSVLFYRKDGLFQSGYTAYRGIEGLNKYIGSAMYEAKVKAPGGVSQVNTNFPTERYAPFIETDNETINKWLNGETDLDNIKSKSAFVASYGPPIALPPFREGDIDYTKLRLVLMRHMNYPIIISNDRKLYTMGSISRYTDKDLSENYRYHIRANDNWFAYSGVDVFGDTASDKLHVGEIKPMNGVEARFVTTLSVTSDLGTIVSLNETDKEWYIAGNPHYNNSFCKEKAEFSYDTLSFDFSNACTYDATVRVGAVKITGLQRLIGDGNGAVATDNAVYYTGTDGKVWVVRFKPTDYNYLRIREGKDVMPEPLVWDYTEEDKQNGADKLYAVEIGLPNMNPALIPTILLNDGSIAFPIRQVDDDGNIVNFVKHFYVNEQLKHDAKPGDAGNVRMVKLLGPTVALGENGKLYYFTDVPALGISYNPQRVTTAGTVTYDNDYLAFVYGDPVQQFDHLESVTDKKKFFQFQYGELDINKAIEQMGDANGDKPIANDFVLMPYNPYTDAAEDISINDDNTISIITVPYRPFRTNAHLFVNMSKNAKYNYLLIPHYMYAFDKAKRTAEEWVYKENGLVAGEVRHNDIAKVYGSYTTPEVPFKYTPYGRNTAYFGNKKGIFSFIDYNVRKTKTAFVDIKGNEVAKDDIDSSDNAKNANELVNSNTPDYFYKAKVVKSKTDTAEVDENAVFEEASGRNNYIGNAFISESRMSNYPNNSNYTMTGFEPQLLSSWIQNELKEYPTTKNNPQSDKSILPGYIPQYRYEAFTKLHKYSGIEIDKSLNDFIDDLYQYAYGVGMFRLYSSDVYPVWRARKFNTEILQMQSRFGSLIPMTHGQTASYLFNNYKNLFDDGEKFNNTSLPEDDTGKYVYPRLYTASMYTIYDADMLRQLRPIEDVILAGIDISKQNLGKTIQESARADIDGKQGITAQGSGIGYILLDGNFMWRDTTSAAKEYGSPVSNSNPLNKSKYFLDFVAYH